MELLVRVYGQNNLVCIFLDYGPSVVHYLKTFSKFVGRASMHGLRCQEFRRLFNRFEYRSVQGEDTGMPRENLKAEFREMFGLELEIVDFIFDSSTYSGYETKISQYQL